MIAPAPASRAPCTAARPTAPQPITITLSPCAIAPRLSAAPTPVMTPQPIRQARSNGISFGTGMACWSGTMQYSPNDPRNISCCKLAAVGQRGAAFAVERTRLRPFAEIFLAQDRRIAVAIKAMPAMRIPRQHDMVADLHAARLPDRLARRRRRPRAQARSASDSAAIPRSLPDRYGKGPPREFAPARSVGFKAAAVTVSTDNGVCAACSTAARYCSGIQATALPASAGQSQVEIGRTHLPLVSEIRNDRAHEGLDRGLRGGMCRRDDRPTAPARAGAARDPRSSTRSRSC